MIKVGNSEGFSRTYHYGIVYLYSSPDICFPKVLGPFLVYFLILFFNSFALCISHVQFLLIMREI